MHTRSGLLAAVAISAVALAGCTTYQDPSASDSMSAGTTESASMQAQACTPVAGDTLVVLADDMNLQLSDNVVPAVNADSATDPVMAALDVVSAALDTPTLIQLNKSVDVERQTSADVAAQFVSDNGLTAPQSGTGDLVVGTANFSENITLGEIYAAVLRDAGYTVEVRTIGSRETYMPALQSGEIDIVPEYAATATEYLNKAINGADAATIASGDIDTTMAAVAPLAEQSGIVFGTASAAQDQNAFATTQGFVDAYGVTTLSELAAACGPIILGGPAECPERAFCQVGLEDTYGIKIDSFLSLDAGGPLTKTAITDGDVALGLVFSSDGALG
ncbi:glycine betaine ABC transporter substrate-binding protein [Demequina capsici]|uniref:Glycine betaine ABC transporter substrate-binding protein n=1 Tax=Demequina capsici TaxID=3075620 RepID=A0AA96JGN8_9MICO|nr:glycine betaine ABC transporter substrate-binding protein [Demequina sp. PMTSA13]WNM28154.1 glycine betaine ABC transporter substrate-binding protein [Demequina sp. PMTSA13]